MRIPSPVIGRVRPGTLDAAKPVNVRGIDGDTFGADVGKAVSGLAAPISTLADQMSQRDTQYERFDALQKLSKTEAAIAESRVEISRTARPDGSDVPERVANSVKEHTQRYLSEINPNLHEEMKVRVASLEQREQLHAFDFKTKAQDAQVHQSVLDEVSKAKTAISQDPEQADAHLDRLKEMIIASPLSTAQKQQQLRMVDVELRKVEGQKRAAQGEFNRLNADPLPAAEYVTERIIGVESGGDATARNPRSSAVGLGQFTSDTWLELIKRTRPDFAANKTDSELLAWRTDPQLSKEMTTALQVENAKSLREAGFAPTPTNLYLAHFLGKTGALRVLQAPNETRVETVIGAGSISANSEVFAEVKTVGQLREWAADKMGVKAQTPAPSLNFTQDSNGYWVGPGVTYELAGKTRAKPVSREYVERVVPAIQSIDPALSIKITSGGQNPGEGTGSHRHDVDHKGEAGTSDFVLVRNGKVLTPETDKATYVKVAEELAAQGFTGIGHYKWGLHVGGGKQAAWGPSRSSADLDPDFKRAIERGWARGSDRKADALDTDLRYANIPYEDRVIMRQAAQKDVQHQVALEAQQRQAMQQQFVNNLQHAILDGKAGQREVDAAYQAGMLSDFSVRKQVQNLVDNQNSEAKLYAQAQAKMATPGAIWDPTNKEDKNMLNAAVRANKGLEQIEAGDKEYFSNVVVPMVRTASDIPTELVGKLMGMVRSNNLTTSLYAIDALSQLQKVDQRAYDHRVSADLQRDVEYFNTRRGTKPDAELMNDINGGSTFEAIQMNTQLRKQAKDMLADKVGGVVVQKKLEEAILAPHNGWFTSKPGTASLRWAGELMMAEAQNIFADEFVREKDVNKAVEATAKLMAKNWGVSTVNDVKVMMKHPPEQVRYPAYGGDHSWINKSIREELQLPATHKIELLSDAQTSNEFERNKRDPNAPMPSYMLIITDDKGRPALKMKDLPDGRQVPYRMNFKPSDKFMSELIDKQDHAMEVARKEQEIAETQSYLLFGTEPSAARRELEAQLALQQQGLAELQARAPKSELALSREQNRAADLQAFKSGQNIKRGVKPTEDK
jgi:hypothetical protein